ncbi:MAG TPA: glycerophosphodiester phosphodiesterase [Candidatus Saccharimonadales bacterium]|nr:glycerophosphodiester phosphodiesterase [Candidatus Saccharimonadales bacterium]
MKIIGHRGAKGLAPENTLASFKKALEHHVDQIEFDLRVTRDHIVVINHNKEVADPAGTKLLIRASTLEQLRRHKPDLMTFQEFLDVIDHRAHLLVEIKPGEPTKQIIAMLKEDIGRGRPAENISVGSFSQSILRQIHTALPRLELVVIEHWSGMYATWRARRLGARRINMRSWWLWRGFLRAMHRRGYQISPYTMNSEHNRRRLQKWRPYIYGVITDYPDRFKRLR